MNRSFAALCFLLTWLVANAEDIQLEGAYTEDGEQMEAAREEPKGSKGEPSSRSQTEQFGSPENGKALPLRFSLEDRSRFRKWLARLCNEDPLEIPEAERTHQGLDKKITFLRATNKQGSLLLLLENFAELAEERHRCEKNRKSDPSACMIEIPSSSKKSRKALKAETDLRKKIRSRRFWVDHAMNRVPAGIKHRTDVLEQIRPEMKAIVENLRKHFFELRNAADLDEIGRAHV